MTVSHWAGVDLPHHGVLSADLEDRITGATAAAARSANFTNDISQTSKMRPITNPPMPLIRPPPSTRKRNLGLTARCFNRFLLHPLLYHGAASGRDHDLVKAAASPTELFYCELIPPQLSRQKRQPPLHERVRGNSQSDVAVKGTRVAAIGRGQGMPWLSPAFRYAPPRPEAAGDIGKAGHLRRDRACVGLTLGCRCPSSRLI